MSLLFVACVLVDVIRALASSRELLSPGSAETAHATRGALKGSIFFSDPFLSGLGYELVSLRPVCYRLFSALLIPLDSLWISGENHVLEISGLDSGSGLVFGLKYV